MPPKKSVQKNEFHMVRLQEHMREFDESVLSISATHPSQHQSQNQPPQSSSQANPPPQSHQTGPQSYFVPTLVSLCADVIASNFATLAEADGLMETHPKLYESVLGRLSTDLPINISVPRIRCENYWRRCCETRWSFGQLSERTCGRLVPPSREGWKQFFLERVLSDFLTGLRTQELSDEVVQQQLDKLCLVCRDYVYTIELPCQVTRFDLYERLLSRLRHVEELRLTFGVSNVGIEFDWSMIGFNEADALNIRYALRKYPPLRILRLPNNRLNSSLLKGILSGLANNNTITVLDFSSNRIDDEGAKQLALLLCKEDLPLEELDLHDNQIRDAGAAAFGESLTMNTTLRVLNLRLNRISDEEPGGADLIRGIASHKTLEVLDLSHNILGDATAQALAEVLPQQQSLLSLNIAGNKELGHTTGEILLKGIKENKTIRFFDARNSGIEKEYIEAMESHVENGVQAIKAQEVEAKEEAQRERIRQQVEEKLSKTLCVS